MMRPHRVDNQPPYCRKLRLHRPMTAWRATLSHFFLSRINMTGKCYRFRVSWLFMLVLVSSTGFAQGLDLEHNNQITICTATPVDRPTFTLLFTGKPLGEMVRLEQGRITAQQLAGLGNSHDAVVLAVGGKGVGKTPLCYDYFFGNGQDGDQPWNNGTAFNWQGWTRYSDEVWDNLAIADGQTGAAVGIVVTTVVVRRGGMRLFDSRKERSLPNDTPIAVGLDPTPIIGGQGVSTVVDLGLAMGRFKRLYYELDNNPVLQAAYADLGQTDSTKYVAMASSWCSEFAAYVYRASGISAPDPKQVEINWRVFKAYYRQHGTVYGLREVAGWSQREREARIKPGALVSIVTAGGSSHTMLLTQWRHGDADGSFTAISGNNRGMVWHHASMALSELVNDKELALMSRRELTRFEARSFIAVPAEFAE